MTYKEAFIELTKQINSGLESASKNAKIQNDRFFDGAQYAYWELGNSAFNLENAIDGIEETES